MDIHYCLTNSFIVTYVRLATKLTCDEQEQNKKYIKIFPIHNLSLSNENFAIKDYRCIYRIEPSGLVACARVGTLLKASHCGAFAHLSFFETT